MTRLQNQNASKVTLIYLILLRTTAYPHPLRVVVKFNKATRLYPKYFSLDKIGYLTERSFRDLKLTVRGNFPLTPSRNLACGFTRCPVSSAPTRKSMGVFSTNRRHISTPNLPQLTYCSFMHICFIPTLKKVDQ